MGSKVIIASSASSFVHGLRTKLSSQGYEVCAVCVDSYDLMRRFKSLMPDVVILDDELTGVSSVTLVETLVFEKQSVLVVGKSYQKSFYQQQAYVEFIEKPISVSVLVTVLRLLTKYGQQVKKLETKVDKLEKKQKEEKLVQKAKRLLQSEEDFSEEQAHQYLLKRSMELRISKAELAARLIKRYEIKV